MKNDQQVNIANLKRKLEFHETQVKLLKHEIESKKKQYKQENQHCFTTIFEFMFPDVIITLCREYTDFVFCLKCNSVYSRYGSCFHKLLNKSSCIRFRSVNCAKLMNKNSEILVGPQNLDVALAHFRDQNIWHYLVLQLHEKGFYFDFGGCADATETIRKDVELILYKLESGNGNTEIIVHLHFGGSILYFAYASYKSEISSRFDKEVGIKKL